MRNDMQQNHSKFTFVKALLLSTALIALLATLIIVWKYPYLFSDRRCHLKGEHYQMGQTLPGGEQEDQECVCWYMGFFCKPKSLEEKSRYFKKDKKK